jgi:hypothetical protein
MCVCIEITAVSCDQTRRDTVGRPFIFLPVCWLSSAAKTIKKQPLPPPYLGSIHSWGKATGAPSCRPSGAGPKRNFLPATARRKWQTADSRPNLGWFAMFCCPVGVKMTAHSLGDEWALGTDCSFIHCARLPPMNGLDWCANRRSATASHSSFFPHLLNVDYPLCCIHAQCNCAHLLWYCTVIHLNRFQFTWRLRIIPHKFIHLCSAEAKIQWNLHKLTRDLLSERIIS